MKNGYFVISLDFELHWGAPEDWDLMQKKQCFDETRKSIPRVLDLFKKYDIHATWATVGFLFAKNIQQLKDFSPERKPQYINQRSNNYNLFKDGLVGKDENDDPYHFAPSLIHKIINTPGQELATHTFSHYYCNEAGQNVLEFEEDLKAAQRIAYENFEIELKSIVFPRNQFNEKYLEVATRNGIKVARSNPDIWFWKGNSKIVRLARGVDTLISVSGPSSYNLPQKKDDLLLLPASRFFRPYSIKEKRIQKIKMRRIKNEMTFAAKSNQVYHLWWHPHNFGDDVDQNMQNLEDLLQHFKKLNSDFYFESKTMIELYQ